MKYKPEPEEEYNKVTYNIDGVSKWFWRHSDVRGFERPAREWYSIRDAVVRRTPGRDIIIQAGGCCGMYPRLWSKYFRIVHTFEPVDNNFRALCMNCPSDNILKHLCALGDSNDPIIMVGGYESIGDPNDKSIEPTPQNSARNVGMYWAIKEDVTKGVKQLMIDQLQLGNLDAMQLDVEGYEIHVLKGAIETIKRCSPTICVENYNDEIKDFLEPLGYKVVDQAWNDSVLVRQ